jgi:linoleoyl-CoA desaturase
VGVAAQDLRLGRWLKGRSGRAMWLQTRPVARKMARQVLKDYVFFPLLAGPFFLTVMLTWWPTACATSGPT